MQGRVFSYKRVEGDREEGRGGGGWRGAGGGCYVGGWVKGDIVQHTSRRPNRGQGGKGGRKVS